MSGFLACILNTPQIECDLVTAPGAGTADSPTTVWRHVYDNRGCASTPFEVDLGFSTERGGAWFDDPAAPHGGATGCMRVRLLIRRDPFDELKLTEVKFTMSGCPDGEYVNVPYAYLHAPRLFRSCRAARSCVGRTLSPS